MNTQTLIIDEVSMVSYLMFDRMNQMAKVARDEPDLPFGGIQLIVFGDFCQLPPVLPHQYCFQCGQERTAAWRATGGRSRRTQKVWECPGNPDHGDIQDGDKMWAFKSAHWDDMNFEYVALRQAHRQEDPNFLNILTNVRHGKPFTSDEIGLLTDHECDVTDAVMVTAWKNEAFRLNEDRLEELPGKKLEYRCQDDMIWHKELHPDLADFKRDPSGALLGHAYECTVYLKKGQPVILQRNIDVSKGLVNGSQGIIVDFVDYDEARQRYESSREDGKISQIRFNHIRDFMAKQREKGRSTKLPVVRFNNIPELVTVWPDCSVKPLGFKEPHSLLMRTQIPLLAGWALTIHKAQGMTLEKAVVNMKVFSSGMAYVALSRVKTLCGLKVKNLGPTTVMYPIDDDVKKFLKLRFNENFD